jgi:hypothetical protein
VKEFHPLFYTYNIADRPTEIATRVQDAINRKNEDHFKKKTKKQKADAGLLKL